MAPRKKKPQDDGLADVIPITHFGSFNLGTKAPQTLPAVAVGLTVGDSTEDFVVAKMTHVVASEWQTMLAQSSAAAAKASDTEAADRLRDRASFAVFKAILADDDERSRFTEWANRMQGIEDPDQEKLEISGLYNVCLRVLNRPLVAEGGDPK